MAKRRPEILRPGDSSKGINPEQSPGPTDIKTLFKNPVRIETLKNDRRGGGNNFDGVRFVCNLAGVQGFPQTSFTDPAHKTIASTRDDLKRRISLVYGKKQVAFARLVKSLGTYTNTPTENTLYAVDFMYL